MEILPLVLALLFVFVAVRVARLAVDPSARQVAPCAAPAEPAAATGS
ncbi:hypothetical protein [Quadrisphaera sp. DSM 44207]|nr:hypothetical protein [Quadrisphaera sp. DSM 44207]SDQ84196.1 hypothetical protein SAMN05428996_2855 [Quadrisphaera sp. DSM 44207]